MISLNLYCLPYAGGNKYSYRKFEEAAPSFIKIVPLEYPGRGARMGEPLITDLNRIVNDLYNQVKKTIDQKEYAIYGHSMGGLAACLLAKKLKAHKHTMPQHLFVTGTTAPSAPSRGEKKRHLLGKKEFIDEIKALDGSPQEILDNEELLNFFEPILRADFTATENYCYEENSQLDIPITVITGTEEDMKMEDVRLWQEETSLTVDFRQMPGKHFFILKYAREILGIMEKKLLSNSKIYQL